MSHLKVIFALASTGALLFAQDKGSADRMVNVSENTKVEADRNRVGNEKTVGVASENSRFRTAADNNAIGNAKTVGGVPTEAYVEKSSGVGAVGNSKTVGER